VRATGSLLFLRRFGLPLLLLLGGCVELRLIGQQNARDPIAAADFNDTHFHLTNYVQEGTTAFYGNFFFWVNAAALLLQAFVASRLLLKGGFGAIFLLLPVISLLSYLSMALVPILAVVRVMKIAENATDYSINNTARQVLWLPTTIDMKYRAKPTIDTFFVRGGDGLAAATVLVGVQLLDLTTRGFFAFNISLGILWLGLAALVVRGHARMVGGENGDARS